MIWHDESDPRLQGVCPRPQRCQKRRGPSMIAFTLLAIGFGLLAYAIHWAHKRDRAELVAEHESVTEIRDLLHTEGMARLRKVITGWENTADSLTATIENYRRLRNNGLDRERDLTNQLVVEQARADWSEQELARIAEQVEGKCLWPTLAENDVVVQFPIKRDGQVS